MSVLEEMERVYDSGSHGRIAIVDIIIEPDKVDAFNQVERIRDPSHVRALTFTELKSMMQEAGLTNIKTGHYKVTHQLYEHLQASFTQKPEDLDKMRQICVRYREK